MQEKGTRKALRKLKADKRALLYAITRRQGGGARECYRRSIGGFHQLHPLAFPEQSEK